jgi:peptidyl-tRNA hydrolase
VFIENWSKKVSDIPPYLRDDQTPYALPIVLKLEKFDIPSHEEVLLATSNAIASMFANETVNTIPEWMIPLDAWIDGRIRKVCRRARGAAWEKVTKEDNVFIYNAPWRSTLSIALLPPYDITSIPESLQKLQVSGLDLVRDESFVFKKNVEASGLYVSLNPEVKISTGKSMAQISHAVQLAIFNANKRELSAWEANGKPIYLADWSALNSESVVEIQDAGFTEVEPGTVTAKGILIEQESENG